MVDVKQEQMDAPPGFTTRPLENVNRKCDFNQTIANLNAKHGVIDKDCNLSSDLLKKLNLFGIWKILNELRNKRLEELDLSSLQPYYNVVEDAEKLNINVKWLHERLDEIRDAIVSRNAASVLQDARHDYITKRDEKKEMLQRLQVEVKKIEDGMSLDNVVIDEVDEEIKRHVAKFRKFQRMPLLDGLI